MAEQLTIPPIRTALTGDPAAADNGTKPVAAKDYWLFWQRLGAAGNLAAQNIGVLQENINELNQDLDNLSQKLQNTIRFGTHAQRVAAPPDPLAALWVETDRNNLVYQAQTVAGAPAWVYVTGAMYGTVIATDQRPTGLGVNDTGLIFLSSDSTSVRWSGSNWLALDRVLDLGPAPPVSQLVAKANGAGALSLLTYSADSVHLGFDVDFTGSAFIARAATCAWLSKLAGVLQIMRSSGNTPGGAATQTPAITVDLTNGNVGIGTTSLIAPLICRVGANANARFSAFGGGVSIDAVNDAFNANVPFVITGSTIAFNGGGFQFATLPAGNPGAGSRQLWYDPADGNRVKYAP